MVFTWVFPEREPVAVVEWFALRANSDLFPAVAINIGGTHIVTATPSVTVSKDIAVPLFCGMNIFWHTKPGHGVGDAFVRQEIIDHEVLLAVVIYI